MKVTNIAFFHPAVIQLEQHDILAALPYRLFHSCRTGVLFSLNPAQAVLPRLLTRSRHSHFASVVITRCHFPRAFWKDQRY